MTISNQTLLSLIRDGQLQLVPDITSALLSMVDAIRQMLNSIESAGHDGENEYPELIQQLTALQMGISSVSAEATPQVFPSKDAPTGEPKQPDTPVKGRAPISDERREDEAFSGQAQDPLSQDPENPCAISAMQGRRIGRAIHRYHAQGYQQKPLLKFPQARTLRQANQSSPTLR